MKFSNDGQAILIKFNETLYTEWFCIGIQYRPWREIAIGISVFYGPVRSIGLTHGIYRGSN